MKKVEFSIDSLTKNDYIIILGRCYSKSIAIGDRFNSVYQPLVKITEEEATLVSKLPKGRVDLCVKFIKLYGEDVDKVDYGLTAKIYLTGNGDNLKEGLVLEGWDSSLT